MNYSGTKENTKLVIGNGRRKAGRGETRILLFLLHASQISANLASNVASYVYIENKELWRDIDITIGRKRKGYPYEYMKSIILKRFC